MNARLFGRIIGIDYSGQKTPVSRLPGLRIFVAEGDEAPREMRPPGRAGKYWTRHGIADWLTSQLSENCASLVGINHGFSYPLRYFEKHEIAFSWPAFLDDFARHWPTDQDNARVDQIRMAPLVSDERAGNSMWRRLTEQRAGIIGSHLHFVMVHPLANMTRAGLPWLRRIRLQVQRPVHFWPFDGFSVPAGRSVIAEVYPAQWVPAFRNPGLTKDQQNAYCVAAMLQAANRDGTIEDLLHPNLSQEESALARIEGWILGVQNGG